MRDTITRAFGLIGSPRPCEEFTNGWRLSAQDQPGSYSTQGITSEIAMLDADGEFIELDAAYTVDLNDQVVGHVPNDRLCIVRDWVASQPDNSTWEDADLKSYAAMVASLFTQEAV